MGDDPGLSKRRKGAGAIALIWQFSVTHATGLRNANQLKMNRMQPRQGKENATLNARRTYGVDDIAQPVSHGAAHSRPVHWIRRRAEHIAALQFAE